MLFDAISLVARPLQLLHLSFHKGCINEINFIAQELQFNVTSMFIPHVPPGEFDGQTSGNALYNMGHDRAKNIWNKHKDYFNQFDAIITSDTAPLARIFLQNNFTKPLIIWVCNRFDYFDNASLDCNFPDEEYYQLFQQATADENVYIIPYTAYESFYAAKKNVIFNHDVIAPSGIASINPATSDIPEHIYKSEAFFIPPYLNDTSMNVAQECSLLEINTYQGRYNGSADLKDFKGIIHIPYAWSNLALFENIQQGIAYFVPSITFMLNNISLGKSWWMNVHDLKNNYHMAEWYNDEHREIITYFDSWEDLKNKIESTDFDALRTKIKNYAQQHREKIIQQWKKIFTEITAS
jgi:hypothetical protein